MKRVAFAIGMLALGGCQTYQYADKVKMIAFDDNLQKGQSTGNIRGEDCQAFLFGYALGPAPKLDRAIEHLQRQTEGKDAPLTGSTDVKETRLAVRYLNDVTTTWDGFDAVVYKKNCLIVKGRGYK